jgi:hypothetical protein
MSIDDHHNLLLIINCVSCDKMLSLNLPYEARKLF